MTKKQTRLTVRADHPFIYIEGRQLNGTQYLFLTLKNIIVDGKSILDITNNPVVNVVFPALFCDGLAVGEQTMKNNFDNALGSGLINLFEIAIGRPDMAYREELELYNGKELLWENISNYLGSFVYRLPFIKLQTNVGENVFGIRIKPQGNWENPNGFFEHTFTIPVSVFSQNIKAMAKQGLELTHVNSAIKAILSTSLCANIYKLMPDNRKTYNAKKLVDSELKTTFNSIK